jgi:hypothetical protein
LSAEARLRAKADATKQSTLSFRCFMGCLANARNDVEGGCPPSLTPPLPSPSGRAETRSTQLTNFWHCGYGCFSFRTAPERVPGNQPSMVLAEDGASKGSGNADSQPNVRSSGEGGQGRPCLRDSGCVAVHPAYRRPASYRPLRAVWAVCAWALRGCARSPDPFGAQG